MSTRCALLLGHVQETPYDLRFSIFGIPVRVHPLFWAAAAFFTWKEQQLDLVLVGIGCVFVSILVHELGHALTAMKFGWPPHIVLYYLGGYASYTPSYGHTPQRSILISLAGPGAGFVLYGIMCGVEAWIIRNGGLSPRYFLAIYAITLLKWINLFWGLINLLPVYPLDGGQISRTLFTWLKPAGGLVISLKISIVIGGAAAAYFVIDHHYFAAILFGSLAFGSYQELQAYLYGNRGW